MKMNAGGLGRRLVERVTPFENELYRIIYPTLDINLSYAVFGWTKLPFEGVVEYAERND
jgi:hypothetical protein